MKVLVCGGRGYNDARSVAAVLDPMRSLSLTIIEGGAAGADHQAAMWARRNAIRHETFAADWQLHGKAAGPIRNQRMLDEGKPDLVIAFSGGRGTADMVRRARAAGVEVREVHP